MTIKIPLWTKIAFVMLITVFFNTSAIAVENDKHALENAEKHFYVALNQMFMGDLHSMKEVWSHAADVTYMGPGGEFDVGWDSVLKTWEKQATMKLGGKVAPVDTHIVISGDIAVVNCYEKGEIQNVSIRATNVFRKESGKWKMIGHHTDLLPYLSN